MNKTVVSALLVSLLTLSMPGLAQQKESTSAPGAAQEMKSAKAEMKNPAASSAVMTSININSANAEQLAMLSGIGPAKAATILAYREINGPFNSVDDLTKVSGIGPATIEKNRHLITTK